MKILGIETSCDETAIAIVEGRGNRLKVLKNIVYSQVDIHAEHGGVVPEVAAREHMQKLLPMIEAELSSDGADIDGIAVTAGPGLAPALRTGVEVAKVLAYAWNKPLIGVSHLEGHIYANWLPGEGIWKRWRHRRPKMPFLCLMVSGGHTELVLMENYGIFKRLGETIDDAAGEAFDKVARMLGLGYPGGPKIAKLAEQGRGDAYDFPRGLLDKPGYDFSFSGLKTSVLYTLRNNEDKINDEDFRADIAASFQEAVIDVLVKKTMKAVDEFKPLGVGIAGGVSANRLLRSRMEEEVIGRGLNFYMPEFAYSLDNASMIAGAGYFRLKAGDRSEALDLVVNTNLDFVQ